MIYLCEREIGFDAEGIGFPSVLGCRAIVVVTAGGLVGYHLNGGLNAAKQAALVTFVAQQKHAVRGMYAASTGSGLPQDHAELRGIAQALGHAGAIYWIGLPSAGSAYVHVLDLNHMACLFFSRSWVEMTDSIASNKAAYVAGPTRAMANGAPPLNMYTAVSEGSLSPLSPTKV